jgi:hypothetical protein
MCLRFTLATGHKTWIELMKINPTGWINDQTQNKLSERQSLLVVVKQIRELWTQNQNQLPWPGSMWDIQRNRGYTEHVLPVHSQTLYIYSNTIHWWKCIGFVSNTLLTSFRMTAAAICMQCSVYACVPTSLLHHDINTPDDHESWLRRLGPAGGWFWANVVVWRSRTGCVSVAIPRD